MSVATTNELELFHKFVSQELARDKSQSVRDVLQTWDERMSAVESIKRGLADLEAGRTRPVEEWWEEFCRENNIQPEK